MLYMMPLGTLDLLHHLIHRQHLRETGAQRGQGHPLDVGARHATEAAGGGGVAEKKDPQVTHHRLARGRVAADVGFDTGNHDRVDTARAGFRPARRDRNHLAGCDGSGRRRCPLRGTPAPGG